jgi:uncharacterized protein YecT (DUF1311 family)
MIRKLLMPAVLALAACAVEPAPAPGPLDEEPPTEAQLIAEFAESLTPIWRRDVSRIGDDAALLERCLAEHADDGGDESCISTVDRACASEMGEDAAITTGGARRCYWRAIAAWERVLGGIEDGLRASLSGDELRAFEAAQSAWSLYLDSNVRALSAPYEGGSIQGVVAGEARARMLARRALELREFQRALER